MERLDIRAIERISGPSWDHIRSLFGCIHRALIDTDGCVGGTLTTIYVKYGLSNNNSSPFAVVWLKKSNEIIVGLSLPPEVELEGLSDPIPGYKYSGLTRYIRLNADSILPIDFSTWVGLAFQYAYRK